MEEERSRFGRVRTHAPYGPRPAHVSLVVRPRFATAITMSPSKQRSGRRHVSDCEMSQLTNDGVGRPSDQGG